MDGRENTSAEPGPPMRLSPHDQRLLMDIARDAIRATLGDSRATVSIPRHADLEQLAGCFVSLHVSATHRLRGCVGRLDAKARLVETVASMARAVLDDPRFVTDPVTADELPTLAIELSILSPLVPATDPLDFEPACDGIYMTYDGHSGCFLPQVAREMGWSREQLLERLCSEKMGLAPHAWQDAAAQLYRFTTLQIGPEPFSSPV